MRYLLPAILAIILGNLIYITAVHSLDMVGGSYVVLEQKIKQIKRENMELQDNIATESAYTTIYQRAIRMGFIQDDHPIILGQ